jgi:DnaJ-class molecular chaperone
MKYLKITTELHSCQQCEGRGWIWETEYHNQVNSYSCYKCGGTGKLEIEVTEDVTEAIKKLIGWTSLMK